ncbi:MAG: response regulator, partial [Maribacter sp.]
MEKKLIYIADDEKNIRLLIKSFLENAGYMVRLFENGDLLYQAFEKQVPDLIVIDIMMPGTDGLSILEKIRN